MSAHAILVPLLALAVLLAWVRLLRWQLGSPPEARAPAWRLALLIVAQPLCAALLYFTFVPPPSRTAAGALVVATRGAGPLPALTGSHVVALPEASALAVAERVPDLGTALRRYPDTARIIVVGEGLPPRDRDAARGLRIDFRPATAPRGIVHVAMPKPVAPGGAFEVGGRVRGVGGSVELVDPAGRRVDRQAIGGDGQVRLRGTVRGAGTALFELRRRNGTGRVVERASIPVVTVDENAPRLLLLAGAPGPETKFLRRWAVDAGIDLHSQMTLGGGVTIGDTPIPITRGTLDRFDLAILDERSWSALGSGERAAMVGAVRSGLGLLLRVTGPVPDATRRQWQAFGFAVSGGSEVAPWRWGAADSPPLTRRALRIGAGDAAPLSVGRATAAITSWRAEGRGRVALWPLTDSYALTLEGRSAEHAELWSETVAALARGRGSERPRIDGVPRAGTRVAICGLPNDAGVDQPDGARARLVVHAGCAAFWPDRSGWHAVQPAGLPFYVQADGALPGVRATEAREATLRLAAAPADRTNAHPHSEQPGASWPWFLAWLAASAALWWFERARRSTDAGSNA